LHALKQLWVIDEEVDLYRKVEIRRLQIDGRVKLN
jgi:hypothetical protein